jgi:hypothetical protein
MICTYVYLNLYLVGTYFYADPAIALHFHERLLVKPPIRRA